MTVSLMMMTVIMTIIIRSLCPVEFIQRAYNELLDAVVQNDDNITSNNTAGAAVAGADIGSLEKCWTFFDVYNNDDDRNMLQQVLTETVQFFRKHPHTKRRHR